MAEQPIMTVEQWNALPQYQGRPTPAHAGKLWRHRDWDNCWSLCEYVPDDKPGTLRVEVFRVRIIKGVGVLKGAA